MSEVTDKGFAQPQKPKRGRKRKRKTDDDVNTTEAEKETSVTNISVEISASNKSETQKSCKSDCKTNKKTKPSKEKVASEVTSPQADIITELPLSQAGKYVPRFAKKKNVASAVNKTAIIEEKSDEILSSKKCSNLPTEEVPENAKDKTGEFKTSSQKEELQLEKLAEQCKQQNENVQAKTSGEQSLNAEQEEKNMDPLESEQLPSSENSVPKEIVQSENVAHKQENMADETSKKLQANQKLHVQQNNLASSASQNIDTLQSAPLESIQKSTEMEPDKFLNEQMNKECEQLVSDKREEGNKQNCKNVDSENSQNNDNLQAEVQMVDGKPNAESQYDQVVVVQNSEQIPVANQCGKQSEKLQPKITYQSEGNKDSIPGGNLQVSSVEDMESGNSENIQQMESVQNTMKDMHTEEHTDTVESLQIFTGGAALDDWDISDSQMCELDENDIATQCFPEKRIKPGLQVQCRYTSNTPTVHGSSSSAATGNPEATRKLQKLLADVKSLNKMLQNTWQEMNQYKRRYLEQRWPNNPIPQNNNHSGYQVRK